MNADPTFMRKPRKILLATDLSCRCDRALGRATLLSKRWHAALTAIHVLEQTVESRDELCMGELPSWRRAPGRAHAAEEQLRTDVLEYVPWAGVIVAAGDPGRAILGIAEQHEVDMVVTGVTRTEAFGGLLSGSTVSSLIRRAAVPVLVVKDKARREYRRIVVATDFAEASVRVLESALRLFPDTHMTLFRAFETSGVGVPRNEQSIVQFRRLAEQDARGFLAACASAIDLGDARLDVVIEHGDVGQLLCDFVRARRVDLVVTGTHGRAAIMEALIGSDAKRLLNVVPCDLMTVRQRPR